MRHPIPPSAGPLSTTASVALLEAAEAGKRAHYDAQCTSAEATFLPLLITTFGGIVGPGRTFWKRFVSQLGAGYLGDARARFVQNCRVSFSHRVMSAVGKQLENMLTISGPLPQASDGGTCQTLVDQAGNIHHEWAFSPPKRPRA